MGFKRRSDPSQINIYTKNIEKSRARHNQAMQKVTYTLVGQSYRGLQTLRKACGLSTDQKLVRHALTKIAWFAEMRDQGYVLMLQAPDGTTKKVAWADLLTRIRRTGE